jgi:hypothetical protein
MIAIRELSVCVIVLQLSIKNKLATSFVTLPADSCCNSSTKMAKQMIQQSIARMSRILSSRVDDDAVC